MKKSIVKSLFAGIIVGALIFFTGPFLLLFAFIVLTLKFIFTPFGMGRMMMGAYGHPGYWRHSYAFADKIRNMSEEEYSHFQNRMNYRYQRCSGESRNQEHQ